MRCLYPDNNRSKIFFFCRFDTSFHIRIAHAVVERLASHKGGYNKRIFPFGYRMQNVVGFVSNCGCPVVKGIRLQLRMRKR